MFCENVGFLNGLGLYDCIALLQSVSFDPSIPYSYASVILKVDQDLIFFLFLLLLLLLLLFFFFLLLHPSAGTPQRQELWW